VKVLGFYIEQAQGLSEGRREGVVEERELCKGYI
jgi:hypothetical protein